MSFINSTNSAYIYAKLTNTGRSLLAQGNLTYNYWVFGDSEIDYGFYSNTYDLSDNKILSPKDNNPNIKYPISAKINSDIFNTLPAILPIKKTISNVAETRGFFGTNNIIPSNLYKGKGAVLQSNVTGTNSVTFNLTGGTISTGDTVMFQFKNPTQTTASNGIPSNKVIPYLFYNTKTITSHTGNTTITVDRLLPNLGTGSTTCDVYVFPGGDAINTFYGSGTTTPYWNEDTLSFISNSNISISDVPVWNLSIVYTENIAGIDPLTYQGINQYNSIQYNGFKEYLNYTSQNPAQKSIGIIHFSNNTISNFYGEGLKTGTLVLKLPTILWHKVTTTGGSGTGSVIGLTLSAQTVNQSVTSDSSVLNTASIPFSVNYDLLVDNLNNVVGKVFTDLKLVVIEDEELIAAMSYKSNRNWSLPTLIGNFSTSISDNQGLIPVGNEVYTSYLLSNETGNNYRTGLHCQNYLKISRGGTLQNNIKVSFPLNQLPYLKKTLDSTGGFTANKLYLLVQTVVIGQRPVSTLWKKIDVTSLIQNISGNIKAADLEASSFTIDLATYNAAPIFNLNDYITLSTLNGTHDLLFGDESFFFGNVDAQIVATAYKSSFIFSATSALFNDSLNPTFKSSVNDAVYISEVGIYNNVKQLVAIGKLSRPIKKKSSDTIQLQLEIDF